MYAGRVSQQMFFINRNDRCISLLERNSWARRIKQMAFVRVNFVLVNLHSTFIESKITRLVEAQLCKTRKNEKTRSTILKDKRIRNQRFHLVFVALEPV